MKTTTLLTLLVGLVSSAKAGIVEPNVLWDKTRILTCFYDDDSQLALTRLKDKRNTKKVYDFVPRKLSRFERAKVQSTVEANFSERRTGIHFVGWKMCSQTSNPDLVVMEAKGTIPLLTRPDFNGRAVIGEEGAIQKDSHGNFGMWEKSGLVSHVALFTQNRGTVVHEFGHVAGLRHEHIHKDSINDKNCHSFSVTVDFNNLEQPFVTTEFVTSYDNQSIMNYCWLQTRRSEHDRNKGLILSEKDIATLSRYYH